MESESSFDEENRILQHDELDRKEKENGQSGGGGGSHDDEEHVSIQ